MASNRFRNFLAALACAAMAACGGGGSAGSGAAGGGGGGGGAAAADQNVVVTGAITGFGSVFVNGQRYDTSGAVIRKDGEMITQQGLRVGQMVTVQGRRDSSGRGFASSIHQDDNLEGPISSIDTAAQTFVVLAHTVRITPETSFDDSITPMSIAGLAVGMQVEVSGMPNASGDIIATRIEKRQPGVTRLEILGRVSQLDTTARRFRIDNLVVDYSAATLSDLGSAGLANGQQVEVKGNSLNAAGELQATRVELRNTERHDSSSAFRREVEGLITRFVSATDFDVAGRAVTTTASTVYEGGTAADLALNVKVEAEGSINDSGVLVAVKVEFKRSGNAGVEARVDAVNADAAGTGGTITVLGVTVTIDMNTRVEDKSDARIEMFRVNNIAVGDYVRVRGTETGPLALTASRLERRRPPSTDEAWVRGTVRNLARPNLTVLGVPVVTTAGTRFEEVTADDFFANAAGRVVKAKGTENNNTLTAREIEFEDYDD